MRSRCADTSVVTLVNVKWSQVCESGCSGIDSGIYGDTGWVRAKGFGAVQQDNILLMSGQAPAQILVVRGKHMNVAAGRRMEIADFIFATLWFQN